MIAMGTFVAGVMVPGGVGVLAGVDWDDVLVGVGEGVAVGGMQVAVAWGVV